MDFSTNSVQSGRVRQDQAPPPCGRPLGLGARLQDECRYDFRMALRLIRRSPGVAAVVILISALAIGANSAIFSFVNAVVLKKLPVPAADRLALLSYRVKKLEGTYNGYTYPVYTEIAARDQAFEGILARGTGSLELSTGTSLSRVNVEFVSANYFNVLGVRAALGRLFQERDEQAQGVGEFAVVSFRLWREIFAGDPEILGRVVHLNRRPFQIIGVTEPAFRGSVLGQTYDLQIPIVVAPLFQISLPNRTWLQLMGRRKPGVSLAQAEAITRAVTTQVIESLQPWGKSSHTYLLEDGSRGFADARKRLASPSLLLMAAVGVVLSIACLNIAGLLSGRSMERQYETAVRFSLGATRARLVRQALVYSAVLALAGGSCGLLFAHWTVVLLIGLLNDGNPKAMLAVGLDIPVLLATMGVSVLASLLFGFLPAWQGSRPDPINGLRHGGFFGATRRFLPLRRVLVVAQVALSLVLLCGAGVLYRTLRNLQTVDMGFQPERVALVTVRPEANGYSSAAARVLFERLVSQARRITGVDAAGVSVVSPLSGNMILYDIKVPGSAESHGGYVHFVSPGYFQALGTPLLQGRDFQASDRVGSPQVAIVNERLALLYWAGQDPLGKRIDVEGVRVVIGVVKNANYRGVRETSPATVYVPVAQVSDGTAPPGMTLIVRMRGNPSAILGTLRLTVRALDADLPVEDLRTLETQRNYGISTERTMAFLSAMFAALATLIALVGLAGVIALGVSSRVREIGLRMVLGANRFSVAWIFLRETLILVAAGVASGLPLAKMSLRVLDRLVFGISAWDTQTVSLVSLLLSLASLTAVLAPVRRAVAIEPAEAIRHD